MRAAVAATVLLMTVLAGCSGGGEESPEPSTSEEPGHEDLAVTAPPVVLLLNVTIGEDTYRFTGEDLASSRPPPASSTSGTVTVSSTNSTGPGGSAGNGTGNQTTPTGTAPLNVSFELGARHLANATGLRWTLGDAPSGNATGDGSASADAQTGTALPATVDRTYEVSGQYQVTYALRLGDGTVERLNVTLVVSNGTANVTVGRPAPDVLHFEYPESLGCAGDLATCVSREGGPESSGIDGFWQELDDRYWGLAFAVVGGAAGDSDCQAFDADLVELGDFSNGGGECTGEELPEGTAYLFLYSYAAPSLGMTLDFTAPA